MLLATSAVAQDKTVTLEIRGAPISRALPVLSKAVGITLLDSPQTKNDVVAIKVKNVSATELMKKVATALNATWQKEQTAYRLVRTTSQIRADQMTDQAFQVQAIKEVMQETRDRIAKEQPWTKERADEIAGRMAKLIKTFNPTNQSNFYQSYSKLEQEIPTTRFADRVFLNFDPAELAKLPSQIEVVYSNLPTPTQRKLNPNVLSAVNQFVRNMNLWRDAREAKGVGPVTYNNTTYYFGNMDPYESGNAPINPTKILVSVSRWGTDPQVQMEICLADANGKIVSRTSNSYYPQAVSKVYQDLPEDATSPTLPISPEEEAWIDVFSPKEGVPLSPEIRSLLLTPEKNEPLGLVATSAMFALAKAQDVNFVGYLCDRNCPAINRTGNKLPTVAKYRRTLALESNIEESDGWMVVSPKRAYQHRLNMADRGFLGTYLRRVGALPGPTIEEQAKFALGLPEDGENIVVLILQQALYYEMREAYYSDKRVLRFYGLLTPEQVKLAKGTGLPMAALKPAQREMLNGILYAPYTELQYQPADPAKASGEAWMDFQRSLRSKPTEGLPGGIPPNGFLKLTEVSGQVIGTMPVSTPDRGTMPPRYFSADELAMAIFAQQRPDIFPWMNDAEQRVNVEQLRFGNRRIITLEFKFEPELHITRSLAQYDMGDGKPRAMSALPEEFRKKVQDGIERHKNVNYGQSGGGGGKNIPPAP
jgi:hypothetical protein